MKWACLKFLDSYYQIIFWKCCHFLLCFIIRLWNNKISHSTFPLIREVLGFTEDLKNTDKQKEGNNYSKFQHIHQIKHKPAKKSKLADEKSSVSHLPCPLSCVLPTYTLPLSLKQSRTNKKETTLYKFLEGYYLVKECTYSVLSAYIEITVSLCPHQNHLFSISLPIWWVKWGVLLFYFLLLLFLMDLGIFHTINSHCYFFLNFLFMSLSMWMDIGICMC